MIYLDWAATAPPDSEALHLANEIATSYWGNPSSQHALGQKALDLLSQYRNRCAKALCVKSENIIFTSGGTEGDHLPMAALLQRPAIGTIVISSIEHSAIVEQAMVMESLGWKIKKIPVTKDGFITPEAVIETIDSQTSFISIMAVNNETGAIQPIKEIADVLAKHCKGKKKPHFHVDAVQAIGKVPFIIHEGIDSLSISAHKIGGPRGVGILYLRRRIEPLLRGGGQESGIRSGTENLAGIAGLTRALEKSVQIVENNYIALCQISHYFIEQLLAIESIQMIPKNRVLLPNLFSPTILQLTNKQYPGEVVVRLLSEKKIYISTGSACSSRKKNRPVLAAMKMTSQDQQNAFRISFGNKTTKVDIDSCISALRSIF